MANNASLDMMDELEDVENYRLLNQKQAENRAKMNQRHKSFPETKAPDIIQDDEELMPGVGEEGEVYGDNGGDDGGNSGGEDGEDSPNSGTGTAPPIDNSSSAIAAANKGVWGKHFPRIYSRGLVAVTGFAYSRLVQPKGLEEERDRLFAMIGTEEFTKSRAARYKWLETELLKWKDRRSEALNGAKIDDEDARAIGELSADIMQAKGKEVNPMTLLIILLLMPVLNVFMISVTHVFQYRTR